MPPPRPPCGTVGGWWAHRRRDEDTCQPCRDALAREQNIKRLGEIERVLTGRTKAPRALRPCGTEAAARRHARLGTRWQDCPACVAAGVAWG